MCTQTGKSSNINSPSEWPHSFPEGSDSDLEHASHVPRWCESSYLYSDLGPRSMQLWTESEILQLRRKQKDWWNNIVADCCSDLLINNPYQRCISFWDIIVRDSRKKKNIYIYMWELILMYKYCIHDVYKALDEVVKSRAQSTDRTQTFLYSKLCIVLV